MPRISERAFAVLLDDKQYSDFITVILWTNFVKIYPIQVYNAFN